MTPTKALINYTGIAAARRKNKHHSEFAPSWVYELNEAEISDLLSHLPKDSQTYAFIFPADWTIQHYRDWRDGK